MGKGQPIAATPESMDSVMRAVLEHLPGFMEAQNNQVLPQARTMLQAAEEISPRYNDLQTSLYERSAPRLAQTGSQVDNISRTGAAKTDLDIMRGSGGELVKESQALDRQLNPEFYKTREMEANKMAELLGSINLNDANPEAERLINQENVRSGNIGNPSATGTVANALSFGSELDKRRTSLSNALNTATNFLQPSQGSFNPVQTALGRPSANTGENRFAGNQAAGNQAYQTGQGMFQGANDMRMQENDLKANKQSILDQIMPDSVSI